MFAKATTDDFDSVYNLICELENAVLPKDTFFDIFKKQTENEQYYCLLYKQNETVIGVLNLRFEQQLHHSARIAEIMEFAVDKNHRHKGIGREMIAQACKIATDNHCVQIEVACNQIRVNAHRFYQREGFQNSHCKFSKPLYISIDVDNKPNK